MNRTTAWLATVCIACTLMSTPSVAQTIDYNLNQAMRSVAPITSALQRLRAGDANGLKRLTQKLDKAIDLLETSESTAHPDYAPTADKLYALRTQLTQRTAAGSDAQTATSPTPNAQPAATATQAPASATTQAQTMDYNLSKAMRDIDAIGAGLRRLNTNDITAFNRLSQKLEVAAALLQTSASKGHPNYQPTVQQWTALQQRMAEIAVALQQAQAAQQKLLAEQQARQAAEAAQQRQAKAEAAAQAEAQRRLQAQTANDVLNPMKSKYNRGSLPSIAESPTPDEARAWASRMQQLRSTQAQADLAQIDELASAGTISDEDARSARYWISDGAQLSIEESIRNARQRADGTVASLQYSAELINAIDPEDKNGAYRFAGGDSYGQNQQRLDGAIMAGAVLEVYNSVFGLTGTDRSALLAEITAARTKLDKLKPVADAQAVVIANAEPANPRVKPDFLKPAAQAFWFEGNLIAESEHDGSIWIDGTDVADITHNGEIWIDSNEMGSI
ncbi:MAG: hypothetical protein AAF499_11580, partial [Pseudomonadota bacterium]